MKKAKHVAHVALAWLEKANGVISIIIPAAKELCALLEPGTSENSTNG